VAVGIGEQDRTFLRALAARFATRELALLD
jgi:hypothetical protein